MLETTQKQDRVDQCLRTQGADAGGSEHFHPTMLRKLYGHVPARAKHRRAPSRLQPMRHDPNILRGSVYRRELLLPSNFSSLKPQSPFTGTPKGRPKGAPNKAKPCKPPSARSKGSGSAGQPQTQNTEFTVVDTKSSQDAVSAVAREPATCPSAAPGTPPEVAVRFAIMMEESTLPKTTMEKRLYP